MYPELCEVEKIEQMNVIRLEIRKDRERLIIWIIWHTAPIDLEDVVREVKAGNRPKVEHHVWAALDALNERNFDPEYIPGVPDRHRLRKTTARWLPSF